MLASRLAPLLFALVPGRAAPCQTPVSVESLLREMVDRDEAARWPAPAYTCRQFSSYDRSSTSPQDADTWFANGDAGQFLRVEEHDGRKEWVMMDADGPGAVVRIWSANPAGQLRVYLDGAAAPVIEAPMTDLLGGRFPGGTGTIGAPLSATRARGWNLYLPIPYREHCKITADAEGFYYQVDHRRYDPGTEVRSFRAADLEEQSARLAEVQRALARPDPEGPREPPASTPLSAGESRLVAHAAGHSGAVRRLEFAFDAPDPGDALRTTVLTATFDGERTIWCPLGDFFGCGPGRCSFETWWRSVTDSGRHLRCRWVMPFRDSAEIRLLNLGTTPVAVRSSVEFGDWNFDERSLHFGSAWHQENPIHTQPRQDWNFVTLHGEGVYRGDSLAVANPVEEWWGEGDEKIFVDGETFPSHFGTGTEDYYGYAWCSPEVFTSPFHAQPRCDGPSNYGHTVVSRVRLLDGIPFRRSLRMDLEVWHWVECDVGYAATTYWYARPGATASVAPAPEEAARGVLDPPPLPPPFVREHAVECEDMEVTARSSAELGVVPQDMRGFGRGQWSNERHLWVQARRVGDFVELEVPTEARGPLHVTLYATRSWDYGVLRFTIDGRAAGEDVDLFNAEQHTAAPSGPLDLGVVTPVDGRFRLRAEVVGSNARAEGTRAYFGLDCLVLEPGN